MTERAKYPVKSILRTYPNLLSRDLPSHNPSHRHRPMIENNQAEFLSLSLLVGNHQLAFIGLRVVMCCIKYTLPSFKTIRIDIRLPFLLATGGQNV
jgi:hypothetical protein